MREEMVMVNIDNDQVVINNNIIKESKNKNMVTNNKIDYQTNIETETN